jgi:hypothetical protein
VITRRKKAGLLQQASFDALNLPIQQESSRELVNVKMIPAPQQ